MENYLTIARKIFAGTRYDASYEDVKRLADNIALLEKETWATLIKGLLMPVSIQKYLKRLQSIILL